MNQKKSNPNILLIFTDQHRLSALSCYGETPCKTPNIDRLATEGVLFERAYTTCPVCTPARGSVLTGEYPHKHGMRLNLDCHQLSAQRLRCRNGLLSHCLEKVGYRNGYNGKWHLGIEEKNITKDTKMHSMLPSDIGFEGFDYPGHGDGGQKFSDYLDYLQKNGWEHNPVHDVEIPMPSLPRYGRLTGPVESTVAYYLTSNTIDLLEKFRRSGEPWFMWHNFWGPHEPHYATSEYLDMYKDVSIPEWPNFRMDNVSMNLPQVAKRHPEYENMKWEYYEELLRHYYAMTSMIDDQIGRLIDYLDESGQKDNTVIIFTADHGETLGSHVGLGDKGWHHFEEIQRIPFIIWMPDNFYEDQDVKGSRDENLVSLIDVYSTVLDLAGESSENIKGQGSSLMPLIQKQECSWRETVGCEFWGLNNVYGTMVSIVRGNYKYGWNAGASDELYDLEKDPHELHNLINDLNSAPALTEMRKEMQKWMFDTAMPKAIIEHFNLTSR